MARKDGPSLFEAFKSLQGKGKEIAAPSKKYEQAAPRATAAGATFPRMIKLGRRSDLLVEASRASVIVLVLLLLLLCGLFYAIGAISAQRRSASAFDRSELPSIALGEIEVVPRAPRPAGEKPAETPAPSTPAVPETPAAPSPAETPTAESGQVLAVRLYTADANPEKYLGPVKELVATLREQGIDAYYMTRTEGAKEHYVIYAGRFKGGSEDEAKQLLKKCKDIRYGTSFYFKDAIIQKINLSKGIEEAK